jgi:FtsP/CotA-like multicopper oxidase with cupredoxin domain
MLSIPTTPYNPVNQEELIILDDILIENEEIVPYGNEHSNFAVMGRFGNVMLTNGETHYELEVNAGDVVRLYVTNVANVRPYNLSIPGAEMKLVGSDIGQYEYEEFVDHVVIAPAQRVFVDVYFEESGEYQLMNINPHEKYVLGTIVVAEQSSEQSYTESFYDDTENAEVIADIQSFSEYFDKEIDYEITLDVDMGMNMDNAPCHVMMGLVMGDCSDEERKEFTKELEEGHEIMPIEWEDEMNMRMSGSMVEWILRDSTGAENTDIQINTKVGDVIKMRFFNDPESMHPMQHPIHLHGQRFVITHINGEEVENKAWTDTALVPVGSTVDIVIDVTNPGEWMMHCHIAEHLEEGMMASFMVAP